KTHDRLLSALFLPKTLPYDVQELDRKAIIWASSCHGNWKTLRTVFKTRLFSSKAIQSQAVVRERKAAEMVEFVGSRVGVDVDIGEWISLLFLIHSQISSSREIVSGLKRRRRPTQKSKLGKPLNESDIYNLPYLTSIVKETLRLHPPAPLLVPHRSLETLQVMNYTIPDGARLEVNAWAIGRDVSIWGEDAASFRPKRFVGSSVDFRGQDFQLLPFSAGRRMCPGTSLAARQIPLLLANLVWNFNWSLPDGEESATELDMEEKFMLILQKERPLVLVPRRRSLILQVSLEIA
ncbi:(S)-N-methylcoclaurine 3'-hydroxylase isozyme 1 (Fragment), partial [Linum perenne]